MALLDLADACRSSGLRVVEVEGWATRGHKGTHTPAGILNHHTGPGSDLALVGVLVRGRVGLSGPLSQIGLGRDGTVYVIAAGLCYHAGEARAFGTLGHTKSGNRYWLGIEAMNSGSEGWTPEQMAALVRLNAALLRWYRWPLSNVAAHAETSVTGKWDPGYGGRVINMDAFRASVAAVYNNGGSMAITQTDLIAILTARFKITQNGVEREVSVMEMLGAVVFYGDLTVTHLRSIEAKLDALLEADDAIDVEALTAYIETAVERVQAEAREGVRKAVKDISGSIVLTLDEIPVEDIVDGEVIEPAALPEGSGD